jgi:hypothetical protein
MGYDIGRGIDYDIDDRGWRELLSKAPCGAATRRFC